MVKKLLFHCVMCRRFDSRPFQPPPPPSLPGFRVQEAQPFAYAGVDFAGPLYIVNASDTKVWICLYTCCVTRAVHLAPPSTPKMTQCCTKISHSSCQTKRYRLLFSICWIKVFSTQWVRQA